VQKGGTTVLNAPPARRLEIGGLGTIACHARAPHMSTCNMRDVRKLNAKSIDMTMMLGQPLQCPPCKETDKEEHKP
jgi:hypothetical protein